MERILIFAALLLGAGTLTAQEPDPSRYRYPLEEVATRLYSANFGEMRPDHFHSGVDIKTDGVTGKRVVAVADGYVSRASVSPWGYGRALYVTHPDGTTSVYGHLSRFRDDVEKYVRSERLRTGRNRVDLHFPPDRFTVRQGEQIALSGNTGQSFGPHLHFELRDTPTQRTLNTVAAGILPVKDNIPPYIVRIHYVEVDTLRGVPVHAPLRSYDAVKSGEGTYRLRHAGPLPTGRRGYFILEATDRKNGVSNTFGIYRISETVDSETVYEYRMEGFSFDRTLYCNAVSYYPLQTRSRNEVFRLALLDGNRPDFYRVMKDRALVRTLPGQRRTLRIEAEDDCGNRSSITFDIQGQEDENCFHPAVDPETPIVDRRRAFHYEEGDLRVEIPEGALYESIFYRQGRGGKPLRADSTLLILSPVYSVLDNDIPLHTPATLSVRAYVPTSLQPHTTLATRSRKGKIVRLGGGYANGRVTARTRKLGEIFIVADTLPPTLKPRFAQGADLSQSGAARFDVSDNFSGIASFTATIDGKRALVDYSPVQGVVSISLDEVSHTGKRKHRLCMQVTDGCGNTARCEIEFSR